MENILSGALVLGFLGVVLLLIDRYFESSRRWGENFRNRR